MRVFVAGASGAIGEPLIAELIRQGHTVTGVTLSETKAKKLLTQGAAAEIVNVFDVAAVESALRRSKSEIVINQLTALPKNPADLPKYLLGDRKLRLDGGRNLQRAAEACGVRRYIQQASGFFLKPGKGLADESVGLAINASPGVAASAQMYAELEKQTLTSRSMEGIVLRYGFFYGPNTWFHPDGGLRIKFDNSSFPLSGKGRGSGLSFISRMQPKPRWLR